MGTGEETELRVGLLFGLRMFSTERSGSSKHAGQVEIRLAHMDAAVSRGQILACRTVRDFQAPRAGRTDAQIPELLVMKRHIRANSGDPAPTVNTIQSANPIQATMGAEIFRNLRLCFNYAHSLWSTAMLVQSRRRERQWQTSPH